MAPKTSPTYGAIILAGGQSKRMGFPKPWLRYNEEQTFAEKIVKTYQSFGCGKLVLVLKDSFCQGKWKPHFDTISTQTQVLQNQHASRGKLYSICAAASQVLDCDYVFIQNIDNPFITVPLLNLLAKCSSQQGYTTPTFKKKGGHPILVSKQIIQYINEFKNYTYDTNFRDLLSQFERKKVAVPFNQILININTADDYNAHFGSRKSKVESRKTNPVA